MRSGWLVERDSALGEKVLLARKCSWRESALGEKVISRLNAPNGEPWRRPLY